MRHCNVFRPLTAFELLLVAENRPKLLLKVYDILLSNEHTDKAKTRWEKDFDIGLSGEQ